LSIGIILGLALWFPIEGLARATSFLVLVVFALVNAALITIKRSGPALTGVLNNPMWVPVTGFVSSSALVMFQLFAG